MQILNQVTLYVQTNDLHCYDSLKKYLNFCKASKIKRDFHLTTIGSNYYIKRQIKQLFEALGMDKTQWRLHFDPKLTVHQFLKEMAQKNNSKKLKEILKLIDGKLSWSKRQFLMLTLLISSLLLLIGLVPPIQAFLSAAVDLTILGFTFTGCVAVYKLRQNYYCELNKPNFAKYRDSFFLVANILLNITAYGLWIISCGLMSPLIAGLFIAASLSDVVKELFLGIENHIRCEEKKALLLRSPGLNYVQRIRIARVEYEDKKHKNAGLINLTGTLSLSALIATWCLVPGSAFATLGIIAAILFVQAVTHLVNRWNDSNNKHALAIQLMKIHQDHGKEKRKSALPNHPHRPRVVDKPYLPYSFFSSKKHRSKGHTPPLEYKSYESARSQPSTSKRKAYRHAHLFMPLPSYPKTMAQSDSISNVKSLKIKFSRTATKAAPTFV